LLYFGHSG
jgi:hypothetical protein